MIVGRPKYGTKYRVIEGYKALDREVGDIMVLIFDDTSVCPKFRNLNNIGGIWEEHYCAMSSLVEVRDNVLGGKLLC